jgi:hypothetical protein
VRTLSLTGRRKVFKFSLKPVEKKTLGRVVDLPHNRLIPTPVKVEVWRRDRGQCVQCGSTKNLHFDHDIPFSKGGSSLTQRMFDCSAPNVIFKSQIRFCRSRCGFVLALLLPAHSETVQLSSTVEVPQNFYFIIRSARKLTRQHEIFNDALRDVVTAAFGF